MRTGSGTGIGPPKAPPLGEVPAATRQTGRTDPDRSGRPTSAATWAVAVSTGDAPRTCARGGKGSPHRGRRAGAKAPSVAPGDSSSRGGAGRKLSYKDQRDLDRLPAEIERLEASIAADEEALHDPDLFARDPNRFTELTERIARHRAEVEAAEFRWLQVAEMAEQLGTRPSAT